MDSPAGDDSFLDSSKGTLHFITFFSFDVMSCVTSSNEHVQHLEDLATAKMRRWGQSP